MKLAEKRNRFLKKLIVNLQSGMPLLLGNNMDEKVRKCNDFMLQRRTVAKTLIDQGDNESPKVLKFGKDWAQKLIQMDGF